MSRLEDWIDEVVADLDLEPALATPEARDLVLDLSRDVAHGVARPAAPVTAFLLGVAAGQASDRSGASALPTARALSARIQARIPPEGDSA